MGEDLGEERDGEERGEPKVDTDMIFFPNSQKGREREREREREDGLCSPPYVTLIDTWCGEA